jgi:hypothetical protein
MTYGRLKRIDNTQPKMGSAFFYFFVKVRSGPAEWQEEYWLVTEKESAKFWIRGVGSPKPSQLGYLHTFDTEYGSDGILVAYPIGSPVLWVLTPGDLERIRTRAEKNAEDIAANRESWLRDLFD